MTESCKTCRFFRRSALEAGSFAHCHRMPPTPTPDGLATFPYVPPEDWCGEYQPLTGVKASPGLQWLIDNGKRPKQTVVGGLPHPEWTWEFDDDEQAQSNGLPAVVMDELGADPEFATFDNRDTAMLAAARAVESSQYLAMHPEPR